MIRHMLALAAMCLAMPAAAQTISGCGTAAIAKTSLTSAAKLATEAACFGKARDAAAAALKVRQDRIAALTPAPPAPPLVVTPALRVGINLAGLSYYSTEAPFIDRGKLTPWPATTGQVSVPLDAAPGVFVMLYTGSAAVYLYQDGDHTNRNVVSWLGMADTVMTPGRITFHSTGPNIAVGIQGVDPADPIRDVHIVRADQEAAWRAGAIINPDFTAAIGKRFSPHRYMDWGCTNHSTLVSWVDRPKLTDASWGCAPIEAMIAEANASGADAWINVPAQADDDYVRQLATLVRDTLAPGLKLHLEYTNEDWNQSFDQTKWSDAQARAKWGDLGWNAERWYGYRAAQVMGIAKAVLGDRLVGVYATFTFYTDPAINVAIDDGIARANVGTTAQLFGEYAIAPYFGGELSTAPGATDKDWAHVIAMATAGDLDSAFAEIEHGGKFDSDFSLDNIARQIYPFQAAEAKKRGLPLVAYEWGFSSFWFGIGGNDPNQAVVMGFVQKLLADPRMGALYTRALADMQAVGVTEVTHFNDVGGVSIFGPWPAVPDLVTTSPRMEALKAVGGR